MRTNPLRKLKLSKPKTRNTKQQERMTSLKETTFFIKEAASPSVIESLEDVLTDIEGVERALVDLTDGGVKIQFNENQISEEQIAFILQGHGFQMQF
jgi:hypothetical protein